MQLQANNNSYFPADHFFFPSTPLPFSPKLTFVLDTPRKMTVQKTSAATCQSEQSSILSDSNTTIENAMHSSHKRYDFCLRFSDNRNEWYGSLPENMYWLLAVNFTMDNAEVTILQMCVNWRCCCLFLARWFVAKDKTGEMSISRSGWMFSSQSSILGYLIFTSNHAKCSWSLPLD